MTLPDLIAAVNAHQDVLLTLREVSAMTGESYPQVRKWVYMDRALPVVRYGPKGRPRVLGSVLVQFFCPCGAFRTELLPPATIR